VDEVEQRQDLAGRAARLRDRSARRGPGDDTRDGGCSREGRQGRLVFVDRRQGRGADRQGLPCRISEHPDRGRAIGSERVFQRINQEYQSGIKMSTW